MTYRSTKTYGHDVGLSCTFRQWRADSHCNTLHGYALSFRLEFEALRLDDRNWVMDFGGLKEVKQMLVDQFDHTTAVANDDPQLHVFEAMAQAGICTLRPMPAVGCEAFARWVFDRVSEWLVFKGLSPRVRLAMVECREHGANSAMYMADR